MIAIYTEKLTADLIMYAEARCLVAMQFNRQPIDEQRVRPAEATRAAVEATKGFLAARDEWESEA
jgi:hypothetical protein